MRCSIPIGKRGPVKENQNMDSTGSTVCSSSKYYVVYQVRGVSNPIEMGEMFRQTVRRAAHTTKLACRPSEANDTRYLVCKILRSRAMLLHRLVVRR